MENPHVTVSPSAPACPTFTGFVRAEATSTQSNIVRISAYRDQPTSWYGGESSALSGFSVAVAIEAVAVLCVFGVWRLVTCHP